MRANHKIDEKFININSQTADDDNVAGANVKCAPVVQSADVQFLDFIVDFIGRHLINSNSMFIIFFLVELRRLLLFGVSLPERRWTIGLEMVENEMKSKNVSP